MSFFENPKNSLGTNAFNLGISTTTSLKSESDFDLNKDCSNSRSNFKPSNVLIEFVAREIDL